MNAFIAYKKAYLEVRNDRKKNNCKSGNKNCGTICVPKNKKCKKELKQKLQSKSIQNQVIEKHESRIRNLPYEQAIAVSKDGKVLVNAKGSENQVSFTDAEFDSMYQQDVVLTHNHPTPRGYAPEHPVAKGIGFSNADCAFACAIEAKEVRAVTRDYNHSLKPPKEGWNENFWSEKVAPEYYKNERRVYRELMWQVYTNQIRSDKASAEYAHLVMKYTAEALGMKYKREES